MDEVGPAVIVNMTTPQLGRRLPLTTWAPLPVIVLIFLHSSCDDDWKFPVDAEAERQM